MTVKEMRWRHRVALTQDIANTKYIVGDFEPYNYYEGGVLYTSYIHRNKETAYYYWSRYQND